MERWDTLLRNAQLAKMTAGGAPYGLVEKGALALRGGRIAWIGPEAGLPAQVEAEEEIDLHGQLVTPGLVDCHTHLVWGGDRIREFEMRLSGVPYAEIARQGGGINSTVRATRAASEETLLRTARRRLRNLLAEGVTTVEIKSGYGLDPETELRMLRVARRLGAEEPVRVLTTFLGAHAVPPEFAGKEGGDDAYLELVIEEMLPQVVEAGLADAVDAFCEGIAFSVAQVDRLFTAARRLGLPVKLHAEQLSNLGGTAMAAGHGALSADHLEYLDEAGVRAMAAAGTVAVLLPGAFYILRETQKPPVERLRKHGVPMAVATDLNPGSSPVHSLLTTLNLACILFHLTPEEALAGATREAARALGMAAEVGTLEVGKGADLALWEVDTPAALVANLGLNPCTGRYVAGERVAGAAL
jgi:imidazolonepropionase